MGLKRLRMVIADDHDVVRQGIRSFLERRTDWEIVGEASTGREAIELVRTHAPDLVIMDVTMPDLNGLEATRRILGEMPKTRVLILSMHDSESIVRDVLASGARGYVLKSAVTRDLIPAIEALAVGKPYLAPEVSEVVLRGYLQTSESANEPLAERVTDREREVLQFLAQGRTNKEIASILHLSVRTVETHRSNLMEKLQMHSLADLIRYAIQNNLIS